jgi:hypothetical protein
MSRLPIILVFVLTVLTFAPPSRAAKRATQPPKPENLFRFPESRLEVSLRDPKWFFVPPVEQKPEVVALFRGPINKEGFQPTISIRKDIRAQGFKSVERYARRWLKSFPQFGYDVFHKKRYQHRGQESYIIDALDTHRRVQIRQILFLQNPNALILTCTDKSDSFEKTLRVCNEVIASWRDLPPTPIFPK